MIKNSSKHYIRLIVYLLLVFGLAIVLKSTVNAVTNPQSGSGGLVGTIPSPPPSTAATIATPSNSQTFTSMPVTISGTCPSGLLIKIYINNVFSGAGECTNGSYSITVTLFNGTNVIVAEDFDALNQQGPNSNSVTVNFNNPGTYIGESLTLTSSYAKLGTNPGQSLTWPIVISGGSSPYAVSVDWGDSSPTQLLSESSSGSFNINHAYSESGIYSVVIRATDADGNVAYLQLVGVADGPILQGTNSKTNGSSKNSNSSKAKLSDATVLIIIFTLVIAIIITFWLGSRHKLQSIKNKLEKGERPF